MKSLIAELEATTEGSRELDGKVAYVIFTSILEPDDAEIVIWREFAWVDSPAHEKGYCLSNRRFYTTSLDAALTLVPEEHRCSFDIPGKEGGRNHATVVKYSQVLEAVNLKAKPEEITELWNHSYAATPALALCIAALRARQVVEEDT